MTDLNAAVRAGYVAELGFAKAAINERGYSAELVDNGKPDDVPELVVHLDEDEEGRARTLRLAFVPGGADLDETKLLQFWSPLPFVAPDDTRTDVAQAVTIVNESVAIGRFGLQDDGTLYFVYVLALAKHSLVDDDMLGEVVAFVDFHQENFGDYLEGVCDGEVSVLVLADVIRRAG